MHVLPIDKDQMEMPELVMCSDSEDEEDEEERTKSKESNYESDLKCKRVLVEEALKCLNGISPVYHHILIEQERFNALPENGSVDIESVYVPEQMDMSAMTMCQLLFWWSVLCLVEIFMCSNNSTHAQHPAWPARTQHTRHNL